MKTAHNNFVLNTVWKRKPFTISICVHQGSHIWRRVVIDRGARYTVEICPASHIVTVVRYIRGIIIDINACSAQASVPDYDKFPKHFKESEIWGLHYQCINHSIEILKNRMFGNVVLALVCAGLDVCCVLRPCRCKPSYRNCSVPCGIKTAQK